MTELCRHDFRLIFKYQQMLSTLTLLLLYPSSTLLLLDVSTLLRYQCRSPFHCKHAPVCCLFIIFCLSGPLAFHYLYHLTFLRRVGWLHLSISVRITPSSCCPRAGLYRGWPLANKHTLSLRIYMWQDFLKNPGPEGKQEIRFIHLQSLSSFESSQHHSAASSGWQVWARLIRTDRMIWLRLVEELIYDGMSRC